MVDISNIKIVPHVQGVGETLLINGRTIAKITQTMTENTYSVRIAEKYYRLPENDPRRLIHGSHMDVTYVEGLEEARRFALDEIASMKELPALSLF